MYVCIGGRELTRSCRRALDSLPWILILQRHDVLGTGGWSLGGVGLTTYLECYIVT